MVTQRILDTTRRGVGSGIRTLGLAGRLLVGSRALSAQDRALRTLAIITFLYLLVNGSAFNILNGIYHLAQVIWFDVYYTYGWIPAMIAGLLLLSGVGYLLTEMWRVWDLAVKDTNITQLMFRTLLRVVVPLMALVLAVYYVMTMFNGWYPDWSSYLRTAAWTFQIPLGYFIGSGLNWLIENRERAGLVGTQEQRGATTHAGSDHHIDSVDTISDDHHR